MASPEAVEPRERALYALEPAAFTAARNALAKALRSEGQKDEAARVAKLARPTAAVWALNALARAERTPLAAYLEGHHRARDRQLRALSAPGSESQSLAATAARQERRLLDTAVEAAGRQLEQSGQKATRATLERMQTTLRAVVIEPELQRRLEEGWLDRELEEPGFGALAAAISAQSPEWLSKEIARLQSMRERAESGESEPAEADATDTAAEGERAEHEEAQSSLPADKDVEETEAAAPEPTDVDATEREDQHRAAREAKARADAERKAQAEAQRREARRRAEIERARQAWLSKLKLLEEKLAGAEQKLGRASYERRTAAAASDKARADVEARERRLAEAQELLARLERELEGAREARARTDRALTERAAAETAAETELEARQTALETERANPPPEA